MSLPRPLRRIALLSALCACWATPVSADEIYRWTDAQGNVHFGSTPPANGGKSERWEPSPDSGVGFTREAGRPDPRRSTAPARLDGPTFKTPSDSGPSRPTDEPATIAGRSRWQWQKAFDNKLAQVKRIERQIESAERAIDDRVGRGTWTRMRSDALLERRLERLQAELEQAESRVDEFEGDAHQAGVPMSWLRE